MTQRQTQQSNPYVQASVRRAYVEILGIIWMPPVTCGQRRELSDYDLHNIGEFTRENVDRWLAHGHAGDFQTVTDFHAVCGATDIPWLDEGSEGAYHDCLPQ